MPVTFRTTNAADRHSRRAREQADVVVRRDEHQRVRGRREEALGRPHEAPVGRGLALHPASPRRRRRGSRAGRRAGRTAAAGASRPGSTASGSSWLVTRTRLRLRALSAISQQRVAVDQRRRQRVADVRRDHQDDDRGDDQPQGPSRGRLPVLPVQASGFFHYFSQAAHHVPHCRCQGGHDAGIDAGLPADAAALLLAGRAPVPREGGRHRDGRRARARRPTASGRTRTRRLGGVLDDLGISDDGRVATFGWNTARHLELYFAAPCTGRVLHTLNIRLFPEQLTYIVNHAEDEVIFVDRSLLGAAVAAGRHVRDRAPLRRDGRRQGRRAEPDGGRPIHDYEDLLVAGRPGRVRGRPTRTGPRRCVTRAAPPATRRASSTRTARRSCTRWATMMTDGHRRAARATSSCPSCRCSTPTRGASRTRRSRRGATLVMPGPDLSRAGDREAHRGRAGDGRGRRADDLDGRAARARRAATRRACAPSRAAARPCRRRCPRATASRSACRSCRRGA